MGGVHQGRPAHARGRNDGGGERGPRYESVVSLRPVPGDRSEPTPPEYLYLYREDEPADAPRMQGSPEDVAVVQGGNSRGRG